MVSMREFARRSAFAAFYALALLLTRNVVGEANSDPEDLGYISSVRVGAHVYRGEDGVAVLNGTVINTALYDERVPENGWFIKFYA